MTDYSALAVADIRKYIWQKIQDAGILSSDDYYVDSLDTHLVPIVPAQQIPEFDNLLAGRTYMFYDFETKLIPVQWWMIDEKFTLTILSQNYDVINKINNLIVDLFRRYDESAADLNGFLGDNSNFLYRYINLDSAMSPEPFESEGDYQYGVVSISYQYSRKTGADGRF